MGLRDAIDAGINEIRDIAEEVIASLKIEQQIKQAVIVGEKSVSVSFRKSKNMHVIQQEVVRQITEEGFEVKWRRSCCPEPDVYSSRERDYEKEHENRRRSKIGHTRVVYVGCFRCSSCDAYLGRTEEDCFGNITISWNSIHNNDREDEDDEEWEVVDEL